MAYWSVIAGMGVITFALRASVIAAYGRAGLSPRLRRGLRLVPPAVFMALVTPALVRPEGPVDLSLANPRLLAGAGAALVAWKTRSTLLTIVTGMGMLWALSLVLH